MPPKKKQKVKGLRKKKDKVRGLRKKKKKVRSLKRKAMSPGGDRHKRFISVHAHEAAA